MEIKKIYIEYAELKRQEKVIADAIEKMKPAIIEDMKKSSQDNVKTNFGTFVLKPHTTYAFSPEVEKQKIKLVKLQQKEIQTGIAVETTKMSVTFNPPKTKK